MTDLSPAVRDFLAEQRFAVLATVNPDGAPQQTVMWFLLEGDEIVMNTARGRRKDRNLVRDARVSICVEDGYRYVTLSGPVSLDDRHETSQADIRRLAVRYLGEEEAAEMVASDFGRQSRVTIRMKITAADAHGFEG
ncbi:MAG: PPOX class F420-dependent oxidoreductase [Chloroflexota bacterium]